MSVKSGNNHEAAVISDPLCDFNAVVRSQRIRRWLKNRWPGCWIIIFTNPTWQGFIPAGITGADSIAMVRDFKERWIRNQLLLNKAELNLTDEEKNVEQQIENYRSSLLIYAYEQSYIRQQSRYCGY